MLDFYSVCPAKAIDFISCLEGPKRGHRGADQLLRMDCTYLWKFPWKNDSLIGVEEPTIEISHDGSLSRPPGSSVLMLDRSIGLNIYVIRQDLRGPDFREKTHTTL